jgi:predicted  nucleic acid-binding Zn-ribbon protein
MTPTKYFFLCIASRFGYVRKSIRLADATNETHLLKEAETFLGEAIWHHTEKVQILSMEYWNLKKFTNERDTLSKEILRLQGKFNTNHQEPDASQEGVTESHQNLTNERSEALTHLDNLIIARERTIANAHGVRRNYDGLKIKLDILSKESKESEDQSEIQKATAHLAEIRDEFEALKQTRDKIVQDIEIAHARIQEIDARMGDKKTSDKSASSMDSSFIGDANQQISARQARINSLNTQIRQLHGEIGRYISLNYPNDLKCKKVGKGHRGQIKVMAALRRSIQFNWKLAERR